MLVLPWLLTAAASGRSDPPEDVVTPGNYSVLLRHGSEADCPCFRIPCLVTTHDTPTAATLVLLVEARWDSSECYPIQGSGKTPPRPPPSPPALALVSSTDSVRPPAPPRHPAGLPAAMRPLSKANKAPSVWLMMQKPTQYVQNYL